MNKPFQICIFEDDIASTLTPYQLCRPCYTIPNGFYNLIERIQLFLPAVPLTLMCHPNHDIYLRTHYPKLPINQLNKSLPTLYINGRSAFSYSHLTTLLQGISNQKNYLFINDQTIVGLFCHDDFNEMVFNQLLKAPSFDTFIKPVRQHCIVEEKKYIQLVTHWWDYLDAMPTNVAMDFDHFSKKSLLEGDISSFSRLVNDRHMYIDQLSKVSDYVTLDATKGPIVIEANVLIQPFVHIEGPCVIGANSVVYSHAHVQSSTIGHHCKIGGEVSGSIIQSYSNKRHSGFIGDSLIGEWVNIGAGSTISNLKLSYGPISCMQLPDRAVKNTQRQFLGAIIGDFVRTGVHTLLECGSVISNACSLMGPMPHARFIPPFTWGSAGQYEQQRMPEFLESLHRMMERRNITLSDDVQALFRRLSESPESLTPDFCNAN